MYERCRANKRTEVVAVNKKTQLMLKMRFTEEKYNLVVMVQTYLLLRIVYIMYKKFIQYRSTSYYL